MNPKVLVGCPTWQGKAYLLEEYAKAIKALDYGNYDILIVDNSQDNAYLERIKAAGLPVIKGPWHERAKERIIQSRNLLRKKVLDENYDYLLSVEQDVIVEPNTLKLLLEDKRDLVCGVVLNYKTINGKQFALPMAGKRKDVRLTALKGERPENNAENETGDVPSGVSSTEKTEKDASSVVSRKIMVMTMQEILSKQLQEIDHAHLSCTLISRKILEKHPFRYTEESFDDNCLTEDVQKDGLSVWLDNRVRPKHKPSGWAGIRK